MEVACASLESDENGKVLPPLCDQVCKQQKQCKRHRCLENCCQITGIHIAENTHVLTNVAMKEDVMTALKAFHLKKLTVIVEELSDTHQFLVVVHLQLVIIIVYGNYLAVMKL
ncbi:hypothetical protein HK096_003078 [Nowakowskiella sp. JEL0078]|nr:hypothetical protein HK096_003078 [Nowakowskiella sp. JEL0078]